MKARTGFWSRLTEPHPSIEGPEERNRAYLLSSVLLIFIALVLFASVASSLLIYRTLDPFSQPLTILGLASLVVYILDYGLSRTRHTGPAALILVYNVLFFNLAAIAASPHEEALVVFFVLTLQLGGLFLSQKALLALIGVEIWGIALLPLIQPEWKPEARAAALVLVIMFGALNFVFARIQSDSKRRITRQARELAAEVAERKHAEEALRLEYHKDEQRAAELAEVLISLAALDFSRRAEIRGTNDVFDALAAGLNMFGEELAAKVEAVRASEERLRFVLSSSPAVIYTADPSGDFGTTFVSDNVTAQLGYLPDVFVNEPDFWASRIHPEDAARVLAEMDALFGNGSLVTEYRFRHNDGSWRWMRDEMTLVRDAEGAPSEIIGSWFDITERKQAEGRIEAALEEKEVLLREVYHRVKNNLQIVSSMLNMQAENIGEGETRAALKAMQSRVRSMALIHEKLYQSGDLAKIDFAEYVENLVAMLLRAHDLAGRVSTRVHVTDVSLGLDTAVPCGLIVNELVGNALKHAFPNLKQMPNAEIAVTLESAGENRYTLVVSDNGVGLPAGLDIRSTDTLGLHLVTTLAEQLNGTCEAARGEGTEFRIEFAELSYAKRGG